MEVITREFTFSMWRDGAIIEQFLDAAKHGTDFPWAGAWWRIDPPQLPAIDEVQQVTFVAKSVMNLACEEAEVALRTRDTERIQRAYNALLSLHERRHSPNRPPYPSCTGCGVWPIILRMRTRLGIAND